MGKVAVIKNQKKQTCKCIKKKQQSYLLKNKKVFFKNHGSNNCKKKGKKKLPPNWRQFFIRNGYNYFTKVITPLAEAPLVVSV
jgi:hypothetical protein